MDTSKLMNIAIAAGIVYAAWKYGSGPVKGAALGVAGVIVAKNVPYVQDVLA